MRTLIPRYLSCLTLMVNLLLELSKSQPGTNDSKTNTQRRKSHSKVYLQLLCCCGIITHSFHGTPEHNGRVYVN